MLTTIAYRLTPELLGNVVAYPLTSDFTQAWERLPARRQPSGDRASPRYASLATALRAVAAQPAVLFPRSQLGRWDTDAGTAALLVTTSPIDRWLFTTCVRTWEQVLREGHDADTLSPVLNLDPGAPRPLAEYLERDRAGRIQGPGWLFEAARWNAAQLLAQQPVKVPGVGPLRLRLDTDGDLVCWDDPISTAWRQRSWHAMVYVSTRVITLPGIPDLILRLDAHVTRITDRWYGVRTVRIARSDPQSPLLKLRVRPPWPARGQPHPLIEDAAAEIVQACGLEPIELPTQLSAQLGIVRPVTRPNATESARALAPASSSSSKPIRRASSVLHRFPTTPPKSKWAGPSEAGLSRSTSTRPSTPVGPTGCAWSACTLRASPASISPVNSTSTPPRNAARYCWTRTTPSTPLRRR